MDTIHECPPVLSTFPLRTNCLPAVLPGGRLRSLIEEYRRRLADRGPGQPPPAYCEAVIVEAKSLLAEREAA